MIPFISAKPLIRRQAPFPGQSMSKFMFLFSSSNLASDCANPCLIVDEESMIQNASLCQVGSYLEAIKACFTRSCNAPDLALAQTATTGYCTDKVRYARYIEMSTVG